MNILFIKVECKDRMPGKDGLYTTDKGEANYYTRTGHFNIWEFPIYWFEPVEVPIDAEIKNIAKSKHPKIPNPNKDEATSRYNRHMHSR